MFRPTNPMRKEIIKHISQIPNVFIGTLKYPEYLIFIYIKIYFYINKNYLDKIFIKNIFSFNYILVKIFF